MNVIEKFTVKSLKNNKKWTLVTIIGIIISTAMITAVFTITASFLDMMQRFGMEENGNWHAAFYGVSLKDEEIVRHDEALKELMIKHKVGYAELEKSQNAEKPYIFIEEYDDISMKEFPIHMVSGRLPVNNKEIVIPQHLETNGGVKYNVGDKIKLQVGKRISKDGKELWQNDYYISKKDENPESLSPENTMEYTVVGIMSRPDYEYRWAPGYTAISYFDKKNYTPDDKTDFYMLAKKLDNKLGDRFTSIADKIGFDKSNIAYNTELLRYYGVMEDQQIRSIIFTFALIIVIIIMIASISLIYNAFSISVSERIKQLGMLASVGATKKQKRENVYFEGFIVGMIGIPLGIISGLIGIGITIEFVSGIINEALNSNYVQLHMIISPIAILLTVLFAMLTIFISVYVPAKHASKIMPIEAIRQSKEVKMTSKNIKTSKLTRMLFGFEGELAMKNLKRSRKKYRATIISLTISIVLFLSVATVASYTNKSAEIRLDTENINFDASIRFTNSDNDKMDKVFNDVINLSMVDDYSVVSTLEGTTHVSSDFNPEIEKKINLIEKDGKYLYTTELTSIGDEAFKKYVASIGGNIDDYNDPSNPCGILVNRAVSYLPDEKKYVETEALKIKEGDSLPFEYVKKVGEESSTNEVANFKIKSITNEMPVGAYTNQFGNLTLVTSDTIYDSIVKTQNKYLPNPMLAIKTSDGFKLDTQIQEVFKNNGISDGTEVNMLNTAINAKQQMRISLVMVVFIYGFITLICLICIANIFNTVSTNIALRRKEFAMLRSVGMTPKSFNKMMNFESAFYGIKALMYGLPISAVIGVFLYKVLNDAIAFDFMLPWRDYGIAIVFVFIIVSSTMLYSSTKIRKQNIVDALKDDSF